jgi:TatD DNase family protein
MLIDAHSHLNLYLKFKRFGRNIEPVLKSIEKNKIFTIANSMDVASYRANVLIAGRSKYIVPAFGIHPWNAHKYAAKLGRVKKLIDQSQVIGEIGLDYFFVEDKSMYPLQRKVFNLFLSRTKNKIISVHTKGAEEDVLRLLKKHGNKKVIIHWYSGRLDVLEQMIGQGYCFSLTPEIGYSSQAREIAQMIPLAQILTETDNPGGPPCYTGEKMGTPVLIKSAITELSKIKGKTAKEIEQRVEQNLMRLSRGSLPGR